MREDKKMHTFVITLFSFYICYTIKTEHLLVMKKQSHYNVKERLNIIYYTNYNLLVMFNRKFRNTQISPHGLILILKEVLQSTRLVMVAKNTTQGPLITS